MKHVSNYEIARLLRHVAVAYFLKGEGKYRFQIAAYNKAADAIESSATQLSSIYKDTGKLEKFPGIGSSIASHIQELFEKGEVKHFDEVMRSIPPAMFPLLDIPNFGPKKAYKIVETFELKNPNTVIEDVEKLASKGKIAELEGFGEKSQKDLLESINEAKKGKTKSSRMALPYAGEIAENIIEYMKKSKKVERIEALGSLRRGRDTIGDVDLAVATSEAKVVLEHFVKYPHSVRIIEHGPVSASIVVAGGAQVDLMVQPSKRFGALLQHFTGSKQHNVALRERAVRQGLSLSERGIKEEKGGKLHEFKTEEEFYKFLKLDYIVPELRENRGEIEAAAKGRLPKLVELSDIKGDLHVHTNFDIEPSHDLGKDSMEDLLNVAQNMEYEYIGFADHNPAISGHEKKEITKIIEKRGKKIDQLNKSNKSVRVFNLLEVDILPSGELALDGGQMDMLDGAIVSLHSSFTQDKAKMTERILKGLSHPKVRIFGHPTGRLINDRSEVEADWGEIFSFCRRRDIALEVNASPRRLDLSDVMVKSAIESGCRVIVDTDSHSVDGLELMKYGVVVARRGWCEKRDVVNTMSRDKFEKWLVG